jgi:hypothetical protein
MPKTVMNLQTRSLRRRKSLSGVKLSTISEKRPLHQGLLTLVRSGCYPMMRKRNHKLKGDVLPNHYIIQHDFRSVCNRKKKKDNKPALREGWSKTKKKPSSNISDDEGDKDVQAEDVINKCAGYVGVGETDDVEMKAVRKKGTKRVSDDKVQSLSSTLLIEANTRTPQLVKVEPNPVTSTATHVEKQAKENWQTKHLPAEARDDFENMIAPLVRLKAGALSNPWQGLQIDDVQALVDDIYGAGKYKVTGDGAFYGLVSDLHRF